MDTILKTLQSQRLTSSFPLVRDSATAQSSKNVYGDATSVATAAVLFCQLSAMKLSDEDLRLATMEVYSRLGVRSRRSPAVRLWSRREFVINLGGEPLGWALGHGLTILFGSLFLSRIDDKISHDFTKIVLAELHSDVECHSLHETEGKSKLYSRILRQGAPPLKRQPSGSNLVLTSLVDVIGNTKTSLVKQIRELEEKLTKNEIEKLLRNLNLAEDLLSQTSSSSKLFYSQISLRGLEEMKKKSQVNFLQFILGEEGFDLDPLDLLLPGHEFLADLERTGVAVGHICDCIEHIGDVANTWLATVQSYVIRGSAASSLWMSTKIVEACPERWREAAIHVVTSAFASRADSKQVPGWQEMLPAAKCVTLNSSRDSESEGIAKLVAGGWDSRSELAPLLKSRELFIGAKYLLQIADQDDFHVAQLIDNVLGKKFSFMMRFSPSCVGRVIGSEVSWMPLLLQNSRSLSSFLRPGFINSAKALEESPFKYMLSDLQASAGEYQRLGLEFAYGPDIPLTLAGRVRFYQRLRDDPPLDGRGFHRKACRAYLEESLFQELREEASPRMTHAGMFCNETPEAVGGSGWKYLLQCGMGRLAFEAWMAQILRVCPTSIIADMHEISPRQCRELLLEISNVLGMRSLDVYTWASAHICIASSGDARAAQQLSLVRKLCSRLLVEALVEEGGESAVDLLNQMVGGDPEQLLLNSTATDFVAGSVDASSIVRRGLGVLRDSNLLGPLLKRLDVIAPATFVAELAMAFGKGPHEISMRRLLKSGDIEGFVFVCGITEAPKDMIQELIISELEEPLRSEFLHVCGIPVGPETDDELIDNLSELLGPSVKKVFCGLNECEEGNVSPQFSSLCLLLRGKHRQAAEVLTNGLSFAPLGSERELLQAHRILVSSRDEAADDIALVIRMRFARRVSFLNIAPLTKDQEAICQTLLGLDEVSPSNVIGTLHAKVGKSLTLELRKRALRIGGLNNLQAAFLDIERLVALLLRSGGVPELSDDAQLIGCLLRTASKQERPEYFLARKSYEPRLVNLINGREAAFWVYRWLLDADSRAPDGLWSAGLRDKDPALLRAALSIKMKNGANDKEVKWLRKLVSRVPCRVKTVDQGFDNEPDVLVTLHELQKDQVMEVILGPKSDVTPIPDELHMNVSCPLTPCDIGKLSAIVFGKARKSMSESYTEFLENLANEILDISESVPLRYLLNRLTFAVLPVRHYSNDVEDRLDMTELERLQIRETLVVEYRDMAEMFTKDRGGLEALRKFAILLNLRKIDMIVIPEGLEKLEKLLGIEDEFLISEIVCGEAGMKLLRHGKKRNGIEEVVRRALKVFIYLLMGARDNLKLRREECASLDHLITRFHALSGGEEVELELMC